MKNSIAVFSKALKAGSDPVAGVMKAIKPGVIGKASYSGDSSITIRGELNLSFNMLKSLVRVGMQSGIEIHFESKSPDVLVITVNDSAH